MPGFTTRLVLMVGVLASGQAAYAQTGAALAVGVGASTVDVGADTGKTSFPVIDFQFGYGYAGQQDKDVGFTLGGYFGYKLTPINLQSGRELGLGKPFDLAFGGNVNLRVKNVSGGPLFEIRRFDRGHNSDTGEDFGDLVNMVGFGAGLRVDIHRTALQVNYLDYGGAHVELSSESGNEAPIEKGSQLRLTVVHFLTTNFGLRADYANTKATFEPIGVNRFRQFDHRGRTFTFGFVWATAG